MKNFVVDKLSLSQRRRTPEGYLLAPATFAKPGVLPYTRSELGLPGSGIVRVYRSPEAMLSQETLDSLARAPITIKHPDISVTVDTSKDLNQGRVVSPVIQDNALKGDVLLTSKDSIAALEDSSGQVSMGFNHKGLVPSSRDDADFEMLGPYHVNHVALVPAGRMGKEARVADHELEGEAMTDAQFAELKSTIQAALTKGGQVNDAAGIATVVLDALKDPLKTITDHAKALADDDEKKKRQEAKDAVDKLVKDARAEERKNVVAIWKLRPLIEEEDFDKMITDNAPFADFLSAAIGDDIGSIPEERRTNQDYLQGIVDSKLADMTKDHDPNERYRGRQVTTTQGVMSQDKVVEKLMATNKKSWDVVDLTPQ